MSLKAFISLAAMTMASPAFAGGTMDCRLHRGDCKDLVGKRFWVRPMGPQAFIEVTFSRGDWQNTTKLRNGSVIVWDASSDGQYGIDLTIRMPDGRTGWMSQTSANLLSPTDPVADAKKAAEQAEADRQDCQRRGAPKIGMNATELVETCWRTASRVVKRTTAAGTEENYLYPYGRVVKLVDGKVAEIIESR